MEMVSDQEIADCVKSLLRQPGSDGSASSINVSGVVQLVEAKLGLDLSHKEAFIQDQIRSLLRSNEHESLHKQQFFSVPPQLVEQQQMSSSSSAVSSQFAPIPAEMMQVQGGPGSPGSSLPTPEKSRLFVSLSFFFVLYNVKF